MSAAITAPDEVLLYGTHFPITRPVTRSLVSPFGARVVQGDPSRSDQLVVSEWNMADWRGGMLARELDERTQPDRYWTGDAFGLFKKQLTLPLAVTLTTSGSAAGSAGTIRAWAEDDTTLYAAWDTSIRKYTDATATWTAVGTAAANITDAIYYKGNAYFFHSTGYSKVAVGGGSLTAYPDAGRYACVYDGKLVTVDNSGQIRSSIDGEHFYERLKLHLPAGSYTDLALYYNAASEPAIHVGTKYGLYILDFENQKYYETPVGYAPSTYGGNMLKFRDGNLYVSDGTAVYRYNGSVATAVGLDRDDGLPSYLRGAVASFTQTPNWLVGVLQGTTAPVAASDTVIYVGIEGGGDFVSSTSGYSALVLWTGVGWHVLYQADLTNAQSLRAHFSVLHGENRLWFGMGDNPYYMVVPEGVYDPLEDSTATYRTSAEHITGWYDAGFSEISKIARSLKLRGRYLSSTEYIDVYYATDDTSAWTFFYRMETDTPDPVDFEGGAGMEFQKIRFRFLLHSGDATKTPCLLFASLRFVKQPQTVWAYSFQVDCTRPHRGKSAKELIRCLQLAGAGKTPTGSTLTFGEFTFRDEPDGSETHWVKVTGHAGQEWVGADEKALYNVTVVEI